MRGQIVVCKEFNGSMIDALVWEDSGSLIFIHTEVQFKAHLAGLPHLEPVGFPVDDVFIRKSTTDNSGILEPYSTQRCPASVNLTVSSSVRQSM